MDIRVDSTPLSRVSDRAVVLLIAKGTDATAEVRAVGKEFVGGYATLARRDVFTGAAGQTAVLHAEKGLRVETLVLVGLGDAKTLDGDVLRTAAADAARAARDAGAESFSLALPEGKTGVLATAAATETVVEGIRLGLYVFETYKKDKTKKAVAKAAILVAKADEAAAQKGLLEGTILAESVLLVRDLGNEPGNVATPTFLAAKAREIAQAWKLEVKVFERDEMAAMGMGSLLGVAQGSSQPPKLIMLTYAPAHAKKADTIAVVGKGLTFDSGGISIKPADKMEDMKFDMCGGAAVLGVMQAVARLALPIRVVGLVPASENMPDASAYKPGDILTASNGTTIEIVNTDAEGRLILADALAYATSKLDPKPKAVVDMATLTGACVVALGSACAGLVSNNDKLAKRLETAGEASGDHVWRLPLRERYREQIKSIYADVKNSGGREAGALTAAAFLEKFVGDVAWAHLDIAGTAWTDSGRGTLSRGGTGFGVRVIVRMLQAWGRG